MDIYCFGDSITLGEYDGERGGWVDRLKTECIARFLARGEPDDCVFNLGIGGETTQRMRVRFKHELATRVDPSVQSLLLLAYGAVDSVESGGRFLVPREEYVENIDWAIDQAREHRCEVWILNVTPVAPAADGVRTASGRLRSNDVVSRYNEALRGLSRTKATELIDVNSAFGTHERTSLFAPDGVHPNAAGHALIHGLVHDRRSALHGF
jgi:lysophospholipase L1-like esterase